MIFVWQVHSSSARTPAAEGAQRRGCNTAWAAPPRSGRRTRSTLLKHSKA